MLDNLKQKILQPLMQKINWIYRDFDFVILSLLAFILLFPKMPLISVSGTYVNVRVEDFLVAGVYIFWLLGFIAGKYKISRIFNSKVVLFFLFYGLIITLLGIFVFKTVSEPHLGLLHWFRRVEYIGMYFIAATVARRENLTKYIYGLLAIGVLAWIYGVLQWQGIVEAYHTLNKSGEAGTYKEIGYVISTFGAHYDFGAFLILMLALSVWGYYSHQKIWQKLIFIVLAIAFWWIARLTYARAAYLGMLVSLIVMFIVRKSAWAIFPLWEVFQTFNRYFGGKFSRYTYDLKFDLVKISPTPTPTLAPLKPVVVQPVIPGSGVVNPIIPANGSPIPVPGPYGFQTDPALLTPVPSTPVPTPGIVRMWLDENINTWSNQMKNWFGKLDINLDPSANVRIVEWQDAMTKVNYHFLWGAGYYANGLGADNDYLRHLVEVGIIGLSIFLLLIKDFALLAWRNYRSLSYPDHRFFHLAIIGFTVGLLIEAVFIDIFAASKIAFLFWYLMGLVSLFSVNHENEISPQIAR